MKKHNAFVRALCALLLLCMLFATVGCSGGVFGKSNKVASGVLLFTPNFSITAAMMSYLVYTEYSAMISVYQRYSEQFGTEIRIPAGKGGTPLDASKGLREQVYALEDGTTTTWFDFFAQKAEQNARQMLALCEAAKAAGVELSDTELDRIDIEIKSMGTYAIQMDMKLKDYIGALYGNGVKEQDVRDILAIRELANKYDAQQNRAFLDAVTEDQILAQYEAHNLGDTDNKYDVYVDCFTYTFCAQFTPSRNTDKVAATEENEARAAAYEAEKAAYLAYATELEQVAKNNPDGFADALNAILQTLFLEEEKKAALADKGVENATLSADELQACTQQANARAAKAVEAAYCKDLDVDDAGSNDAREWLREEARQVNDVLLYTDANDISRDSVIIGAGTDQKMTIDYASSSSTYSVYLLKRTLHKNDGVVRSVGHILFRNDVYDGLTTSETLDGVIKVLADRVLTRDGVLSAQSMAQELLALMREEGWLKEVTKDGASYYTMDKASFETYARLYSDDGVTRMQQQGDVQKSVVGEKQFEAYVVPEGSAVVQVMVDESAVNVFYDDVTVGQMVEEFEGWLFDEARVEGEISYPDAIGTTYGYHIIMYTGNEKPAWSNEIREELGEANYKAWSGGLQQTYSASVKDATLWDSIGN